MIMWKVITDPEEADLLFFAGLLYTRAFGDDYSADDSPLTTPYKPSRYPTLIACGEFAINVED